MVQLGKVFHLKKQGSLRFRRGKAKDEQDSTQASSEGGDDGAPQQQEASSTQSSEEKPDDYYSFPKKKTDRQRADDVAVVEGNSPINTTDLQSDPRSEGTSATDGSTNRRKKKKRHRKNRKQNGKSSRELERDSPGTRRSSEAKKRQSVFGGGLWSMLTQGGEAIVDKMDGDVDEVFDQIDKDGNGELDREELGELFQLIGLDFSPQRVDALFAQLDQDNDGVIDKDEFSRWYETSKDSIDQRKKKNRASFGGKIWNFLHEHGSLIHVGGVGIVNHIEGDVHDVFDKIDVDGNGELDRDELAELFKSIGAHLSEDELDKVFAQLDHDGDGVIGKEEFCTWYEKSKQFVDKRVESQPSFDDSGLSNDCTSLGIGSNHERMANVHHESIGEIRIGSPIPWFGGAELLTGDKATLERHLRQIEKTTRDLKKEVKSIVQFLAGKDDGRTPRRGADDLSLAGMDLSNLPIHEQEQLVKALMERDRVVLMKTLDELQQLQIGIMSTLDEVTS